MLKFVLSVFLSVSISLGLVVATNHYTPTANYSLVRQATWLVENTQGTCSGVVVGKTSKGSLLLTAAHCDGTVVKVDGVVALKLKKDVKRDLLLLFVPKDLGPALKVGKMPALDEKVATVGFPMGIGEVVTEGRVQTHTSESLTDYMLVTTPGIFGNSGGPVVVRRGMSYELVGIVSRVMVVGNMFSSSPIPHLLFVADAQSIKAFLN